MQLLEGRELRFQLFDLVLGRSHFLLRVHSDAWGSPAGAVCALGQPSFVW